MNRAGRIFLVGPMGVGKSTIGRQLADLLGTVFADTDTEIEQRTGADIPLIFEIEGEPGFRRRESAVLAELTQRDRVVLATGGGAVLAETNREYLRRGIVVYLTASIETLLARTQRDRSRPLLQDGDRRAKIEQIVRDREMLYRSMADIVVTTDQRSPQSVAQEIVAKLAQIDHAHT